MQKHLFYCRDVRTKSELVSIQEWGDHQQEMVTNRSSLALYPPNAVRTVGRLLDRKRTDKSGVIN
jgi:hypothetical protein